MATIVRPDAAQESISAKTIQLPCHTFICDANGYGKLGS
jgi:hypothetical protein